MASSTIISVAKEYFIAFYYKDQMQHQIKNMAHKNELLQRNIYNETLIQDSY